MVLTKMLLLPETRTLMVWNDSEQTICDVWVFSESILKGYSLPANLIQPRHLAWYNKLAHRPPYAAI